MEHLKKHRGLIHSLRSWGLYGLVALVGYFAAQWLLISPMIVIASILVLAIIVLYLTNIEWALWSLIAVAAIRGLLRQIYPGLATYLIVDALIYLLLIYFVMDILRTGVLKKQTKPPLLTWLLLFATVMIIYAFHPGVLFLEALSGLRMHLLTVPLFLFGFYYLDSKESIVRLIHVALLVGVSVALLGIVQYQYGLSFADSPWSGLAEDRYRFHYFSQEDYDMRRAFSTFNSSHEFGMFLATVMILTLGLMLAEQKKKLKALYIAALIIMGVGLALSSTRSGVAMLLVGAIPQVLMVYYRRQLIDLLFVGGAVAAIYLLADSLTAEFFSERVSAGFELEYFYGRIFGYFIFVVWPAFLENPFGQGLSGTLGYIGSDLSRGGYHYVEGYYWNMLYQTGIVGFVIVGILFARILSLSFRTASAISDGWSRMIAVSLFGVILSCAIENFAGGSIRAESVGVMFWLSVGILLKLGHGASASLRKDGVLLQTKQ